MPLTDGPFPPRPPVVFEEPVTLPGDAVDPLDAVPLQQLEDTIDALNLGTASTLTAGTAPGNVPILDAGGKLDTSTIPAIAIIDTFTVASQAAMLALTAQKGDVAVRSDLNKSFILQNTPASTLANWVELLTPTDAVLSVAALTGAISAAALRTALSLVPGTDVQAYSDILAAIVTAGVGANKMVYLNTSSVATLTDLTAFARGLLDDADAATMRATLGLVPGTNVQAYHDNLAALASVTAAVDKLSYFSGTGPAVMSTTDFTTAGRSLVGAASVAAQRTLLGVDVANAGGRLSLQSGIPIMFNQQLNKTTIYYMPFVSQAIPIYDGTNMLMLDFGGQLTNVTTDSSTGKAGPAAVTTDSNYDLFVWNDSGTFRLTRGPAWSIDFVRGSGAGTTELVLVKGVHLNANSITNGPAAQRGTYVGSVRSNGSSQIDFQPGSSAGGGVAAIIGIWNKYNRRPIYAVVQDTTNSYTYTTATWRATNGANGMRVSFLTGLAEDCFESTFRHYSSNSTANVSRYAGIGHNSTTTPAQKAITDEGGAGGAAVSVIIPHTAWYNALPILGYNFVQALEYSNAVGTTTWYGDNGGLGILLQNAITFSGQY